MNKPLLYFTLLILLSCVSCISTKRLTYLQQDSKEADTDFTITKKPDPYRVQINDLLSIRIKSLDQSQVGVNRQQKVY
jgi:polysaccharide export outer membrane protein